MSRKIFTTEEVEKLKRNGNVKSISKRSIVLTKECKEMLYERIQKGEKLAAVLDEIGLDSEVLGQGRVLGIIQKLRRHGEREEGFASLRNVPKSKEQVTQAKIKKLESKLATAEQTIEFLKKTNQLRP